MTTEQPEPVLDDPARMQLVDRRSMIRLINDLPEQCETALGIGRSFTTEPLESAPNVIVISGVGNAGLAGDMAAIVLSENAGVPVVTAHGVPLPACVGEGSLVFVIDYSGRSPFALKDYKEARARGATVICVTSGGKLVEAASKDEVRVVRIPSGQSSRTAIGYLMLPPVAVIEGLGLAPGAMQKVSSGIRLMKNLREMVRFETPTAHNLAKQTAEALHGKTPIIYGAAGYRTMVANRWKSQLGASSKVQACSGLFPDVAEGEICGWEMAGASLGSPISVILRDPLDKATELTELIDASKEIVGKFGVVEVEMKGATTAERMLYGAYLGDYVSYYLALLNGVDPGATDSVALIESRLAAGTAVQPTEKIEADRAEE